MAIETWLGGLHVVHRDALPQLGCSKDRMILVAIAFGALRNLSHGSKEATGAARRADVGNPLWYLAVEGEDFQMREGSMPKAVVPLHQLSLVVGSKKGILVLLGERRRWVDSQRVTMNSVEVRSLLGRRR